MVHYSENKKMLIIPYVILGLSNLWKKETHFNFGSDQNANFNNSYPKSANLKNFLLLKVKKCGEIFLYESWTQSIGT